MRSCLICGDQYPKKPTGSHSLMCDRCAKGVAYYRRADCDVAIQECLLRLRRIYVAMDGMDGMLTRLGRLPPASGE